MKKTEFKEEAKTEVKAKKNETRVLVWCNYRKGPSYMAEILGQKEEGEVVEITGDAVDGWIPIADGWIREELVKKAD